VVWYDIIIKQVAGGLSNKNTFTMINEFSSTQSLSDQACDMLIEIDPLGKITFVHYMNEKIAEILGYKEDELVGKPATDFLVDSQTVAGAEYFGTLYASERAFRATGRKLITKNGAVVSLESDMVPIYDNDRRFVGHRGMEFLTQTLAAA
jgi:PAS domain S-box-containing protein